MIKNTHLVNKKEITEIKKKRTTLFYNYKRCTFQVPSQVRDADEISIFKKGWKFPWSNLKINIIVWFFGYLELFFN